MVEVGSVLDEKVIGHEGPSVAIVDKYISGAFPEFGYIVQGWTGIETMVTEKVFDPCGMWAPDSSNEAQFSQPPLSQEIDKIE